MWHTISTKVSDSIRSIYSEAKRHKVKAEAEQSLKLNPELFNIAVCGALKSGRSRLLKALTVSVGNDTESQLKSEASTAFDSPSESTIRYESSSSDIMYWEVPGTGRIGSPLKNYIRENYLLAFDLVLVFTGDTLREEELIVANELMRYGVECAFVRSKCDKDLRKDLDALQRSGGDIQQLKLQFLEAGHEMFFKYQLEYRFLRNCKNFFVSALYFELEQECEKEKMKLDEENLQRFIAQEQGKFLEKRRGMHCEEENRIAKKNTLAEYDDDFELLSWLSGPAP